MGAGLDFFEFTFGLRDEAVLDFAGALKVATALGLLQFGAEVLDFLGDLLGFADLLFFLEPLGAERGGVFLRVGEFFFQFLEALAAGGILFLFEGGALHFELHDLTLELVEFGRQRLQLDFMSAASWMRTPWWTS